MTQALKMQLRRQVEWAIHCCLSLAELPPQVFLSTSELAKTYQVPKEYLSKAMQALSRAGLLQKAMGPSGGYRLARDRSVITILEIVEAIEGKAPIFKDTGLGRQSNARLAERADRPIIEVMMKAEEAWRAVIRGVTLNDLVISVGAASGSGLTARRD